MIDYLIQFGTQKTKHHGALPRVGDFVQHDEELCYVSAVVWIDSAWYSQGRSKTPVVKLSAASEGWMMHKAWAANATL